MHDTPLAPLPTCAGIDSSAARVAPPPESVHVAGGPSHPSTARPMRPSSPKCNRAAAGPSVLRGSTPFGADAPSSLQAGPARSGSAPPTRPFRPPALTLGSVARVVGPRAHSTAARRGSATGDSTRLRAGDRAPTSAAQEAEQLAAATLESSAGADALEAAVDETALVEAMQQSVADAQRAEDRAVRDASVRQGAAEAARRMWARHGVGASAEERTDLSRAIAESEDMIHPVGAEGAHAAPQQGRSQGSHSASSSASEMGDAISNDMADAHDKWESDLARRGEGPAARAVRAARLVEDAPVDGAAEQADLRRALTASAAEARAAEAANGALLARIAELERQIGGR